MGQPNAKQVQPRVPATAGGAKILTGPTPQSATLVATNNPAASGARGHGPGDIEASSPPPEPAEGEKSLLPTVIRCSAPKGATVEMHAEFFQWKPMPMSASDPYFIIAYMPKGGQKVYFTVNGERKVDSSLPVEDDCNVVTVSEALLATKTDEDIIADPTGWGQEQTVFEDTRKYPPILPPHLRYTPLNTPPTQYRCAADGSMSDTTTAEYLDPEHLPLPLSVTINHVYFQRREDHTLMGATTRHRNKYTTIIYYSSVQS